MHRTTRRLLPSTIIEGAARRFVAALVPLLGGLLLALAMTAPAKADFQYSQPVSNLLSSKFCIGIGGGSNDSGAKTGLYSCDGRANQQFKFFGNRFDTWIKANGTSGMCLRISGSLNAEGSRDVYQSNLSCGSSQRTRWRLTNSTGGIVHSTAHYANIRSNAYPSMCIGAGGGQMFHDNVVKAYTCAGDPNQSWHVNSSSNMP